MSRRCANFKVEYLLMGLGITISHYAMIWLDKNMRSWKIPTVSRAPIYSVWTLALGSVCVPKMKRNKQKAGLPFPSKLEVPVIAEWGGRGGWDCPRILKERMNLYIGDYWGLGRPGIGGGAPLFGRLSDLGWDRGIAIWWFLIHNDWESAAGWTDEKIWGNSVATENHPTQQVQCEVW